MTTFTGTAGNDTLTGTAGADHMNGLPGDDSILSGAGDDTIIGGNEYLPIGSGPLEAMTGDFLIHASTTGTQYGSQAAALTGGGYVVTWADTNLVASFAQMMDDSGNPVGSPITLANTGSAAVTGLSNGDFAVATLGTIGMTSGIVIEIFDDTGSAVGSPFLANTTALTTTIPKMAQLSGGGFIVTWELEISGSQNDIMAQIFDNTGSAVGSEFVVNDSATSAQSLAQATTLTGGNTVVAWQGYGAGDATGVYAKIYDGSGSVVAGEFALNTTTANGQGNVQLASLDNGNFLALWQTDNTSVQGQIFDSTGAAVGSEIDFGTIISTWQGGTYTFAVGLPGGGFLLTYMDSYTDADVYAQMFDDSGVKVGAEIQVNRDDLNGQTPEGVIRLANDNLVFSGTTPDSPYDTDVFNRVFSFDGSGTTPPSDDDYLNGGTGNDSVLGGAGDDTIIGGGENLPIGGGTLEAITGDIIVHSSTTGNQSTPAAAALTGGGYVVTWADFNLSSSFAQIMDDSGNPVGSAFTVGSAPSYSAVAALSNGDFAVATLGTIGMTPGIVVEIFDDTGSAVGSPFLANTTPVAATSGMKMTALSGGDFLVTWELEIWGGQNDIMAQIFDNTGSAVGSEFVVNDSATSNQRFVQLTTLTGGNTVVAWQGYGAGDATGVYAKIYDGSGSAVVGEFQLNTTMANEQRDVQLASLDNGNFLALWQTDNASVQGQIFDSTGAAVGSEIDFGTIISTWQGGPYTFAVGLPGGGFLLTYYDGYADSDIYAQMFDYSGTKVGTEIQVNREDWNAQAAAGVIRLANDNLVFSGTTPDSPYDTDIFNRVFSFDGSGGTTPPSDDDYLSGGTGNDSVLGGAGDDTIIGGGENLPIGGGTLEAITGDIIVHSSTTGNQSTPAAAALTGGGYVVTWADFNLSSSFAQIMDDSGNPVGSAFTVGSAPSYSAVAALSNGDFAVATLGTIGMTPGIVVEIFDDTGSAVGSPFLANTTPVAATSGMKMTALSGGDFLVTWELEIWGGQNDIMAQIFDNTGSAVGSEFVVNDSATSNQRFVQLTTLTGGNTVVAWQGYGTGDATGVYAKIYDGSGSAVVGEFQLNTTMANEQRDVQLASLDNGNFLALWQTDNASVQGQIFDSTGAAVGSEIDFGTIISTWQSGQFTFAVGLPGGGFLLTYIDNYHTDADIYAQMFDYSGTKVGTEIQVNREDWNTQAAAGVIRLANDNLVFSGTSPDSPYDTDVFNRVFSFNGSGGTTPPSDDDYLNGGTGDDSILGGAGDDTIIGGGENLPIGGGTLEAITGDIIVHSSTTGNQSTPAAAALTGGGYVVTWADFNLSSSFAQIMDDSGNPVGSAFTVGSAPSYSAVAALSNGDFAVATLGTIGMTPGIVVEIFDDTGSAVGSPFLANTTPVAATSGMKMTALSGGDFLVTWELEIWGGQNDIMAQIFDNTGSAVGSEFVVNDSATSNQRFVQVTTLTGGNTVVAWQGYGAGDATGVYAKIFDSSGSAVVGEFQLNTTMANEQRDVQLASLDNGNFLALWQTDNASVQGQIFDSTGAAVGSEIDFGTIISTWQGGPYTFAVGLPGGGFLLTYYDGYADSDIYAQMFDYSGTKVGTEIQVNREDWNAQAAAGVIRLANDNLVFSGTTPDSPYDTDIFNRVFSFDGSGGTTPPSDDDYLNGGTGDDSILGGAGDDTIIGGSGVDTIHGGQGSDSFVYSHFSASGVGGGNRDILADFSSSQGDQIDLSAFAGTFSFISTASFSTSPNEVRYSIDIPNNRTLIEVDTSGDGTADMELQLTGQIGLVSGDFVL